MTPAAMIAAEIMAALRYNALPCTGRNVSIIPDNIKIGKNFVLLPYPWSENRL